MKLCLGVLSALVVSGLLACGGTEGVALESEDTLEQVSSALVCSTTCPNGSTVSCEGTTCNTYPGDSVECDGYYHICPPTIPSVCLSPNSACSYLAGRACSPVGGSRSCCINRRVGNCYCMSPGTWACSAS